MIEQHTDASDLTGLNRVVASLYDAAARVTGWGEAVQEVAEFWNADSHVAQVRDPKFAKPELLSTTWVAEARDAYERHFWKIDPFAAAATNLPAGRANLGQELVDPRTLRRTEFFQEYWSVHGRHVFHLMGGTVVDEEGVSGMLGLYRGSSGSPFSRHDQQLFGLLLPHYKRALNIRRRFDAYANQAATGWRSLDALPFGVVAVDGEGRLQMLNSAAEEILRSQSRLTVSNGRLHCASGKDDRLLRARLESCLRHRVAESGSGGGELALEIRSEDITSHLSVFVVPLIRQQAEIPSGAAALIYLFKQPVAPANEALLMTIFALSRAEARVVARLCAGDSPREMSDAFQLSIHTVRNQLKSALRKVGARSQADLVARVAHSPAALFARSQIS